ncbi:hypothetical protein ACVGVM_10310 [Pseudonocardia bannensis]|uniref:Uncharacterized protein n=1 Tax=Pseudonocardia bannensis TaxID=630973 RepID=A0A848DHM9_9PSEU|nr:hypothetical protein [Pseudonocardia bannensis]NMH92055.1 hypothetical protein [Pseudonocardia bannensis]
MASDATGQSPGQSVSTGRANGPEQISDEARAQFVQLLVDKVREAQASDELRTQFVQFLLDKVRGDPFPSREQLDLIEESLPPDMFSDYAQVLMEKAGQEGFPSNEILRRIQRISGGPRARG